MKDYYSSGKFAKIAHITKKTLIYYDKHNILKPSFVNDNGNRYYTEKDFVKLQQILFLKYLGFSLDDIKEITLDKEVLSESFAMQLDFVEQRINQLEIMKTTLKKAIDEGDNIDWGNMLDSVNISELDQKMKKQYKDSSNLSARINLHNDYSLNKVKWFEWIYNNLNIQDGMSILEIGAGDGSIWLENIDKLPKNLDITLSDISSGMIDDISKKINDERFTFKVMDAKDIGGEYDIIIANHVLFYLDDLDNALNKISKSLKPNGYLVCSTYGENHLKQINDLVYEFDDRIVLSAEDLFRKFGKENGYEILNKHFKNVNWLQYEDSLKINRCEPLIAYILSCHGNQNRYIVDKFNEFKTFVKKRTDKVFYVEKDAGVFVCNKN